MDSFPLNIAYTVYNIYIQAYTHTNIVYCLHKIYTVGQICRYTNEVIYYFIWENH